VPKKLLLLLLDGYATTAGECATVQQSNKNKCWF
jgi:hypothetical protein